MNPWFKLFVTFGDNDFRIYVCQLEGNLADNVFNKKEGEFIKLLNVRWTEEDNIKNTINIIKLEDYQNDTDPCGPNMFIRRDIIEAIIPIREEGIFFQEV